MNVRVRIKQKHIAEGVRESVHSCPIALAVKEALLTDAVQVNRENMWVNGKFFELERAEQRFVDSFDNGKRVKPFTMVFEEE